MALPKHSETERGMVLQKIVESCDLQELFHWPNPTKEDFEVFGEIMWLHTGIDFVFFHMRRSYGRQRDAATALQGQGAHLLHQKGDGSDYVVADLE